MISRWIDGMRSYECEYTVNNVIQVNYVEWSMIDIMNISCSKMYISWNKIKEDNVDVIELLSWMKLMISRWIDGMRSYECEYTLNHVIQLNAVE